MARITLCGSTRFKDEFERWNKKLSASGHIVYSVACYGNSGDEITEKEKFMLDKVHMHKIELSHGIFVLDVSGYIGESTQREIDYAKILNKDITYLSEVENNEVKL